MKICRRTFIGGAAAFASGCAVSQPPAASDAVRPEDYGAKGDGTTNDTAAFVAMSAEINRRGGGTVILRRATYLVGSQAAASNGWSFEPGAIMNFRGLGQPLVIRGNGARLRCAPGLRFGAFDRGTDRPINRPLPNLRAADRASPYIAMIFAGGCSAPIEIGDLELDGGLPQLRIGGPYGDTGRQIPATGLFLQDNRGREVIRNIHTHNHALDGIIIDGDHGRRARSRFENIHSENNGRQGLSIVGGRGYDFLRCKFNSSGRSSLSSAPGAGVDIEAEGGKLNRDFTFVDCEFSSNTGPGMIAASGDSADAIFTRCRFIGSGAWSAWPNKPGFRFDDCLFVGALAHAFQDRDPSRATQFFGCTFLDDPARTPDRRIFLGGNTSGTIANLNVGENVLFDRCAFRLTANAELPWSGKAIYRDCTMSQRSPRRAYPRGTYLGRTVIDGNVALTGSDVRGEVVLNGRRIAQTRL